MNIAVPELRRYAPDALRMLGIHLGQADEIAEMVTWTEAVHGGAVGFIREQRSRLLWKPRPRMRVVSEPAEELVVDARGGSLLEFGVRLIDFVRSAVQGLGQRDIRVLNVYGTVFVPYLMAYATEFGVRIDAKWEDASRAERTGTLTLVAIETAPKRALDTVEYRSAVNCGIDMCDKDFAEITQLFEMLRVPTSERSRSHAG